MIAAATVLAVILAQAGAVDSPPTFEAFPAVASSRSAPKPPNLKSHPQARKYRTVLREGAKAGANFAGSYALVHIGCGTSCAMLAVVDVRDGTVYFPESLPVVHWAGWWHQESGPVYQLSSRLLVVYGQAGSEEAEYGVSWFEWSGSDFKLLRFEKQDRGSPPR
jgi:hypothetical protein